MVLSGRYQRLIREDIAAFMIWPTNWTPGTAKRGVSKYCPFTSARPSRASSPTSSFAYAWTRVAMAVRPFGP